MGVRDAAAGAGRQVDGRGAALGGNALVRPGLPLFPGSRNTGILVPPPVPSLGTLRPLHPYCNYILSRQPGITDQYELEKAKNMYVCI